MGRASECNRRYNEAVAVAYASYGRTVSRHAAKLFLLGLVLAGVACIGLINVQTTNDVLNIWMFKGTRLDGEKDFYEEYFGGSLRAHNIMISAADGSNVASPQGLDAMVEGAQPFVIGGTDEAFFELGGETFGLADLCQSPTVAAFFKPYNNTPTSPPAWLEQSAVMSYAYRQVSLCAKEGTGPIPVPEIDLEDGWGIEQFPCSRLSPLDCFQEGNYDYPLAMKQLDQVSFFVAFNNVTKRDECIDEFGDDFENLLLALGTDEILAAGSATAATAQLASLVVAFSTWGYYWRPSYASMTEAEVVAYIQDARDFAFSNKTGQECIFSQTPACCLSWAGTKLETDFLFGDINEVDGTIKHLLTTQTTFPINHPVWISRMEERGVTKESDREAVALGWESALIEELMPRFEKDVGSGYAEGETFDDIDLDFFADRSGNDIIQNGNTPEPYLIWIAYVGMLVFAALSMGAWKFSSPKSVALYSRVLLSLGGMAVIALSTVACLGFISAIGIKLTPLSVSVVPFLSLGIGIDDMFIFVYTLVHTTSFPGDPRKRLETTLVHAGPSVTITSIAVAGCFLVASAVAIPTVRYFSVHMGTQMLFHVVLMHLMLLPMMYWDSVRVKDNRSDLVLVKLGTEGIMPEAEFASSNGTKRFVEKVYAPLLRNKLFKAFVIAFAAAVTATLTWYGVKENTLGVGLNQLAVEGSHQASFLAIFEEKFTADAVSLVTKEVDMASYQETMLEMQEVVQEVSWVSEVSSIRDNSWFADSFGSLLGNSLQVIPEAEFNTRFAAWVTGVGITSSHNFYCANGTDGPRVDCTDFDPATTVIKASQQSFFLRDQASRENNVKMFADMREAADSVDPSRDTYAYSDNFALHSQYIHTWESFGWVIGGGAVMVAVVIAILQGSLVISLLMVLSIVMVVLQVFGLLTVIDVSMNGFSIVNLCVMIGLVVEFTAHIARGFLFAPGDNRDDRVERTLTELLWPTFAGACTTFLAVLPLTFSKITFFHNYYFETFAIMSALGFFAGVCLLPVMLSLVGPPSQSLHKVAWDGSKNSNVDNPMHISPPNAHGHSTL